MFQVFEPILDLFLNIANNGFRTGGKKGFLFLKPDFFFADFRVVTVCPGELGDYLHLPNWHLSLFPLHLQCIGAGFLTSNALASSEALAHLKGKCRYSDKQTDRRFTVDPDWS